MEPVLTSLLGLVAAVFSFIGGKVFGQSEKVLDQKRASYQRFLQVCPSPNEAHNPEPPDFADMQREIGIVSLYGSHEVLVMAGRYFKELADAQETLCTVEEPGHPRFLSLMKLYNEMVMQMRADVMRWSFFAPTYKNKPVLVAPDAEDQQ